jgi:hypothetical protein
LVKCRRNGCYGIAWWNAVPDKSCQLFKEAGDSQDVTKVSGEADLALPAAIEAAGGYGVKLQHTNG